MIGDDVGRAVQDRIGQDAIGRARVRAPALRGRRLARYRRAGRRAGAAARPDRAARLLDGGLRELPARARRARACSRSGTATRWSCWASTPPSSRTRPGPRPSRRRCAATTCDHPVLDDADLVTWDAYAARAWPTLVLVDPRGYVVAQASGEGHGPDVLGTGGRAGGRVRRRPAPRATVRRRRHCAARRSRRRRCAIRARRCGCPDGALLVSDSGHHRLVELDPDLETVRRTIGTVAARGLRDGGADDARFTEPLGLALLPPAVGSGRRLRRRRRRLRQPRAARGAPRRRCGLDGGGHRRSAAHPGCGR